MAEAKGTDLVVAGADSQYLALQMGKDEVQSLIEANIGSRQLDAFSLDRIKLPTSGSTTWVYETLEGEQTAKEISGIIIHWATRRSYWESPDPDGSPPQCSSPDGLQGFGDPGIACHDCQFNKFNTDQKGGPGKACTEFRQLFILREDSLLPIVVNATPGSLKAVDSYFNRLLGAGIKFTSVVTSLALSKERNKGGTDYAQIVPTMKSRLAPDAVEAVENVAAMYARVFEGNARVFDRPDAD